LVVGDRKSTQPTGRGTVPLGRAAARLAKHVELALGHSDLSLPQYRVLVLLGDGTAVASVLASKLAVSPPSVTAIVDGLVARGLVKRHSDGGDRRRVTHALTDKGRRVLSEADAETNARLEAVARHLATRDHERAVAGLRLWYDAMDAYLAMSFKS
jgi:long-chain acyl-CoA synthetase